MTVTVEKLLARGDEISIEVGRLVIRPSSGKSVPQEWRDIHSPALLGEILLTLGAEAYEYGGYSTGLYGPHKAGGVTVQFPSFVGGMKTHAIFNADLNRERTTKAGAKGSPLPKGHFRISPRSHLFQLWQSTGLSTPKSLTSLHDYLGNLRGILFSADMVAGRKNRLDTGTLRPLSITTAEVRKAFQPDNGRTTTGQVTDNCRTVVPDRDAAPAQQNQGFQPKPSACAKNYVKTLISTNVYTTATVPVHSRKQPAEQTEEEWLADCFPANIDNTTEP
ncbi:hypothetical protein BK666_16880 [Pseudomonas frederiksbergensis]|uniref:Uncharacterized protein n=1 Tax=Pseudomonas frederiksbergensis TaxID=104087 RepID=A0A423K2F0_9PSED|nr:hypothetical protein [Pseudomonas frederiksbergensis]RON45085.1 hypothetical protein BK666_16880 [Pseudomonas frederiksbergensis]